MFAPRTSIALCPSCVSVPAHRHTHTHTHTHTHMTAAQILTPVHFEAVERNGARLSPKHHNCLNCLKLGLHTQFALIRTSSFLDEEESTEEPWIGVGVVWLHGCDVSQVYLCTIHLGRLVQELRAQDPAADSPFICSSQNPSAKLFCD